MFLNPLIVRNFFIPVSNVLGKYYDQRGETAFAIGRLSSVTYRSCAKVVFRVLNVLENVQNPPPPKIRS